MGSEASAKPEDDSHNEYAREQSSVEQRWSFIRGFLAIKRSAVTTWLLSYLIGFTLACLYSYANARRYYDSSGELHIDDARPLEVLALGLILSLGIRVGIGVARHYVTPVFPFERVRTPSESPVPQYVVQQLRVRARQSQFAGNAALILILASLVAGVFLFSRAEKTATIANLELLDQYRSDARNISNQILTLAKLSPSSSPRTDEITAEIKALQAERDHLDSLVKDLANGGDKPQSDFAYVTSLLSTKIGSVLLLVFLVQILVTMYRYATRLAGFYNARADALQLREIDSNVPIEQVMHLLSPDKLDFTKPPRSPAESAIDLAKEIIRSQRAEKPNPAE